MIEHNAYIYVGLAWVILIGIYIKIAKTERIRLIAIYSGSVLLAFLLAEIYFSGILGGRHENTKADTQMIYGEGITTHDALGYAPSKNSQWSHKLISGDSVIYDVIQTVDSTGFRYSPTHSNTKNAVLFLGCSFTFGAGLNDDETLPYLFEQSSSRFLQGLNTGGNGYGAHQTLALLQNRLEKNLTKDKILKAGIYTALTDHVFRGNDRSTGIPGPQYVLSNNGQLVFKGVLFGTNKYNRILNYELSKSHLLKRFIFRKKPANKGEIDLFIAMLRESRDLFTKRYNAPFYCLLWDEMESEPGLYERLLTRLNNEQIKVIEVKDILPDYHQDKSKYLHCFDGHPKAIANELIAEYLAKLLTQNTEDNL